MTMSHTPMDGEQMEEKARETARSARLDGTAPVGRSARALRRDLAVIRRAHRALGDWAPGQKKLPGAAEWLLDNHYLALREGKGAQEAFGKGRPLRRCAGGGTLLHVCAQGILDAVPDLDVERVERYLGAFQSQRPLSERELSLLIPALAAQAVDSLSRALSDLEAVKADRVDPQRLGDAFQALRTLSAANWGPMLERASGVERLLSRDPSGHYPHMDEDTRRRYRQQVCRLARRLGEEETRTARRALELAEKGEGERRHIGWYLFRQPMGKEPFRLSGALYGGTVLALSAALSAGLGLWLGSLPAALLLLLPLSDIVKNCIDFLAVRLVRPRFVPRMALKQGIPRQGRTLCVVVSLITGADSGAKLAALLERYHLANRDSGNQLRLGLLCDLPDRDSPMDAAGRAWVDGARGAVDALNEKYGGGFYLFFRAPSFNPRDERYQGWERKRGALVELVRLLKGRSSGVQVLSGDRSALEHTRYVITLDSDTSLNVGTARELVGAMLHPLNQPQLDREKRIVTAGHALLQPRVSVELEAANRSLFSRIFAGQGGVDPYGSTASDVYHDLFGQGTYTGKGIFQVDAFYTCLDRRFPDNAILSHDLLEGSYLRAGLLGEVELTDGFPYQVHSYFTRLHRWVRGDWQLLPWLGRSVPDGRGGREANPLPTLAKWKILDNLRRSLSPALTLVALVLGICFNSAVFAAAGAVAVLAAASNLLLSGAELAARRGAGSRSRYHSTVVAGLAGTILQTAIQLLFLPYQAWICTTAAATALWRMLVSRHGLLAWVTAAQAEQGAGGVWVYLKTQWFSLAVGLVTLLGAQLRIGMGVGLLWMAAPVIAWAISRPAKRGDTLTQADRTFLLHQASLIWGYFADFLRPEDHYLPPDNWQEQPNPGLARRTSPTNIGMALLSVLAGADLDLTSRARGKALIAHILDTVEGLEKWHGHLYNWYDTPTARPLHPKYVSTVDSGNLCGSLIALREGLYEWGEDVLARRAERLAREMDFSLLYDKERKLFSIGYEQEKGMLTPGWYDLMASEARQTSFLAVARGEVPPRHWRRLGRMLLGENDYTGMASWTGTMFEYFMPNLLLPCEPNSLMYESLAFCLYAQRRRGERMHTPWGISESAFYAFDPGMNYQYKAHGVPTLGLKRGLDQDRVVAPYASFLALLLAPGRAVHNLRRLRDMGLEGKYGLYEAVDFTPGRLVGQDRYEVIRSYMSHHLGMSLVAIDNALKDNVMQRRFMRDCEMSAYRELLQERLPVGAPLMRNPRREGPEKPRRVSGPALVRTGEGGGRLAPECQLISNGSYTVFACGSGLTISSLGRSRLTQAQPGDWYAPAGVSAFLQTGEGTLGLTPAPLYQSGGLEYGWEFHSGGGLWSARGGGISCRCSVSVPRTENGERRRLDLQWTGQGRLEGALLLYLEPVLCPPADYLAHPAFARLFVQSSPLADGVLFRRRPRGGEEPPALAVLWEGEGITYTTSREAALGRGGLRALPRRAVGPLGGETGGVLDPCLMLRLPVSLEPGEGVSLTLALAASDQPDAAQRSARSILEGTAGEDAQLSHLVRRLGLEERRALEAFQLLRRLAAVETPRERPPQPELWAFGISGDVPIALGALSGVEELDQARTWCAQHQLLTRCGYPFDLVLLADEGGDYRRPLRTALLDLLKALGAESALGAKGGVHLAPQRAGGVLRPWSKAVLPLGQWQDPPQEGQTPPDPVHVQAGEVSWRFGPEGEVVIETGERLPAAGWSQVLCNPRFGWLTDETGSGLLWCGGNAREGKLTPWRNDPLAVGGDEEVNLLAGEGAYSVFAGGDGLPCTVTYGPGFARWDKDVGAAALTTRALVPPERDCRVLEFQLKAGQGTLRYRRLDTGEELRHPIRPGEPLCLVTWAPEGVARALSKFETRSARGEWEQTLAYWRARVCALTFHTPDRALDHYLSGWGLYQVLACRVFARTSQYQNGGAYGFRDQLQDVCALLYTAPGFAREQLLRCAARQFEEGDVQHWWHPPQGAGVRTRITDDLLWLPYVLAQYVQVTGDEGVCLEQVPYLSSPPLGPQEMERYEVPAVSQSRGTLYQHACRALDCSLSRGRGEHGLALMGSGDWNDGMNRVGERGKGESVWLSWFTALVLKAFAPLCETMKEQQRQQRCLALAQEYLAAAQDAWDGDWYRRGYYDDGAPLGARESGQCQIDSIAQSFAALAEGGDRERANRAVDSALERLYDREHRLVKLFAPPFTGQGRDPGYIRGYLPGVRENGGQYTHGAVWLALACLTLDRREEGWALLRDLLPANHPQGEYRAEPYVLAADVYSAPGHEGRGGWSWYTGAAGWYWRTAVETLLGLRVREGRLSVQPRLPQSWPGYQARWALEHGALEIQVRRTGTSSVLLDGAPAPQGVALSQLRGDHLLAVTVE